MSGTRKKAYTWRRRGARHRAHRRRRRRPHTRGKTAAPPSHQAYAQLFANAAIGQTNTGALKNWPKPYQTYHDAYKHQCYEWWDEPIAALQPLLRPEERGPRQQGHLVTRAASASRYCRCYDFLRGRRMHGRSLTE